MEIISRSFKIVYTIVRIMQWQFLRVIEINLIYTAKLSACPIHSIL